MVNKCHPCNVVVSSLDRCQLLLFLAALFFYALINPLSLIGIYPMEFKDFKETFGEIMPVIYRAAPLIGGLIGSPATNIIIGLLALLGNTNACDHRDIACQLKHDEDLYAKLQRLEQTHAEWLNTLK